MTKLAPLVVELLAHVQFVDAQDVLDRLVRRLFRDPDLPFSPSPAVPVVRARLTKAGDLESSFDRRERAAAVVLVDDHAIADANFRDALDRLVAGSAPDARRVFLVPLTANAYRSANAFAQTNFLRFADAPAEPTLRWTRVGSGLEHELCRWLLGRPRSALAGPPGTQSEEPITVFLSHAKADGTTIAAEFIDHLQQHTRLGSFFDAHDIAPAFRFADEIEQRAAQSILLVIRTDAYGTREWCQREVLAAKRAGVPVVVADALEDTERRVFPYLGNVPTIRYRAHDPQRHERVLDLLLDETLRQLHFKRRVDRLLSDARGAKPVVLGAAPELVGFALARERERRAGGATRRRTRRVVYPDPPLTAPEIEVLAHDAEPIRAESLTQFVARRAVKLAGEMIALSTSEADDAPGLGLSSLHQRDLVVELARHLFGAGGRIAYGGDFRKLGFAELLVQVHRAHARYASARNPGVVSLVREPVPVADQAAYVDSVEFIEVPTPAVSAPSDRRREAAALRAMRLELAARAAAFVVVGGRGARFRGWRPGVAEEVAAAVAARRPLYLIGGFGGVATAYAAAIHLGAPAPDDPITVDLDAEPAGEFALPDAATIVKAARRLRNGLSRAENKRLAITIDVDEIIALVLRGLAGVVRPPRRDHCQRSPERLFRKRSRLLSGWIRPLRR